MTVSIPTYCDMGIWLSKFCPTLPNLQFTFRSTCCNTNDRDNADDGRMVRSASSRFVYWRRQTDKNCKTESGDNADDGRMVRSVSSRFVYWRRQTDKNCKTESGDNADDGRMVRSASSRVVYRRQQTGKDCKTEPARNPTLAGETVGIQPKQTNEETVSNSCIPCCRRKQRVANGSHGNDTVRQH